MRRALLNSLLYFPSPTIAETPASAGLEFGDLRFETDDAVRLHGWWIPARSEPAGHVLLCHGNAGNIGDRVLLAGLLSAAGFDVMSFDYRGYGRSNGAPSEEGTYRDARAAVSHLLEQSGVERSRVLYLGESLGSAIALQLALEHPPAGLVLLSAFTSIRDLSRRHYPFIPAALVPDAYPSLGRIRRLNAPLLILHGERDDIVPAAHGKALFHAAPDPRRIHVVPGLGHNDLVPAAGTALMREIASWASAL